MRSIHTFSRKSLVALLILIDTSARVLDKSGNPIPGLYAAGETAGTSVAGEGYAGYITGEGLLAAFAFGRIAGQHAGQAVTGQQ